jgi:hypothetical protein
MPFDLAAINYLAVLVAGLTAFFIGGFWYQALFGKLWVKLHAYSEERIKEMKTRRPPAVFFGGMVASYLVLAWAVAILFSCIPSLTAVSGAILGAVLWLGPAAGLAMTGHLASDKAWGIYLIDVACELLQLLLIGAILGGWK